MQVSDAAALSGLWSDPEVYRYLPFDEPRGLPQVLESIRAIDAHWKARGYGVWGVVDLASGQLVGYGGLRFLEELGAVEVLYGFARAAWGRGFATELAGVGLEFGFERVKLERIIALAHPDNVASRRVMEKLGMKLTGQIEAFGLSVVRYEISRADWVSRG